MSNTKQASGSNSKSRTRSSSSSVASTSKVDSVLGYFSSAPLKIAKHIHGAVGEILNSRTHGSARTRSAGGGSKPRATKVHEMQPRSTSRKTTGKKQAAAAGGAETKAA